jgi:hypothetical protein
VFVFSLRVLQLQVFICVSMSVLRVGSRCLYVCSMSVQQVFVCVSMVYVE